MSVPGSVIRARPVRTSACAGADLDEPPHADPRRARAGSRSSAPARRAAAASSSIDRVAASENGRPSRFGTQRPTSRSGSIAHAASRCGRNAATAPRSDRRVERDVDAGQHAHRAPAEPRLERGDRGRGAGDRVLAAGRVVVDDLDVVATTASISIPRRGRIDDREPVGRGAVGVARDVRLHQLAAPVHELERGLELERAERVQRRELADAVAGGDHALADRALRAQLGELRGGEREQRRLGELGAEQDAVRVAANAAVGEPQLARVALDDLEQREAEPLAGVRVGALPHGAGGARAPAAVGAQPGPLDALAGEQRARSAAGRRPPRRAPRRSPPRAPAPGRRGARRRRRRAWPRSRAARRARPGRGTSRASRAAASRRRRRARRRRTPTPARRSTRRGRSAAGAPPSAPRAPSGAAGCDRRRRARTPPSTRARRPRPRRASAPAAGAARAAGGARSASAAATGCPPSTSPPAISPIGSPPRSTMPVAAHRGGPPCGTSTVVSARTRSTSPAASGARQAQPGLGGEEVGVAGLGERERRGRGGRGGGARNAVAGASPRIASSASTSASVPRVGRQPGVAAQPGRRARGVAELDEPRVRVAGLAGRAAATPRPAGRRATRGRARAAARRAPGTASSAVSAGQASVSATSSGTPSCAAPVAARYARGSSGGHDPRRAEAAERVVDGGRALGGERAGRERGARGVAVELRDRVRRRRHRRAAATRESPA